jgi:hypothetical protein
MPLPKFKLKTPGPTCLGSRLRFIIFRIIVLCNKAIARDVYHFTFDIKISSKFDRNVGGWNQFMTW